MGQNKPESIRFQISICKTKSASLEGLEGNRVQVIISFQIESRLTAGRNVFLNIEVHLKYATAVGPALLV